jgi:hypothetical protein
VLCDLKFIGLLLRRMYFAIVRWAIARIFIELTNLFLNFADVLAGDF